MKDDVIKINDELTIVLNEEKMVIKRNGLSVSVSYQEMTVVVDHLQKLIGKYENIVKAQMIDEINRRAEQEI